MISYSTKSKRKKMYRITSAFTGMEDTLPYLVRAGFSFDFQVLV